MFTVTIGAITIDINAAGPPPGQGAKKGEIRFTIGPVREQHPPVGPSVGPTLLFTIGPVREQSSSKE